MKTAQERFAEVVASEMREPDANKYTAHCRALATVMIDLGWDLDYPGEYTPVINLSLKLASLFHSDLCWRDKDEPLQKIVDELIAGLSPKYLNDQLQELNRQYVRHQFSGWEDESQWIERELVERSNTIAGRCKWFKSCADNAREAVGVLNYLHSIVHPGDAPPAAFGRQREAAESLESRADGRLASLRMRLGAVRQSIADLPKERARQITPFVDHKSPRLSDAIFPGNVVRFDDSISSDQFISSQHLCFRSNALSKEDHRRLGLRTCDGRTFSISAVRGHWEARIQGTRPAKLVGVWPGTINGEPRVVIAHDGEAFTTHADRFAYAWRVTRANGVALTAKGKSEESTEIVLTRDGAPVALVSQFPNSVEIDLSEVLANE